MTQEPEVLGQRAYARRVGVSHTAVAKAIRSGRLSESVVRGPDGKFRGLAVAKADAEWKRNTDPSGQRERAARKGGKGGKRAAPKRDEDQPPLPGFPVADPPAKDQLQNGERAAAEGLSSVRTRLVDLQAKSQALQLLERAGRLVDADRVAEASRRTWSTVRQTLENLTETISPELATLGGDARKIRNHLRAAVRRELTRLADAAEKGSKL